MAPIDDLLARMDALLQPMRAAGDERQHFLATYMRTTVAVKAEIERGAFVDGDWTERWDIAFADLYLDALDEWNVTGSGSRTVADRVRGGRTRRRAFRRSGTCCSA